MLDVCFDKTRPELIERVLGQYVLLLRTGKPPARTKKLPARHVHPGIAAFVRLHGERAGNSDSLPLPTRELVRVTGHLVFAQADATQ